MDWKQALGDPKVQIDHPVKVGDGFECGCFVWLCENTKIGDNVFIDSYCKTGPNSVLGDNCVMRPRADLATGTKVGNNCFIGPGAKFLGEKADNSRVETIVEDDVYIGANAVLHAGIRIGKGARIGACSNVTKDVPAGVLAYGNPCKVVKKL